MAKKEDEGTVTVEFAKTYVSSRGLKIQGRKGDTCELPVCEQVTELLNAGTLKAVKGGAAKRETATKKATEES